MGRHELAFLAATLTLGVGGAVAAVKLGVINFGVFSHDSPSALFKANPASLFPSFPGRDQVVIPRTVHRTTTVTVPGVGTYEYWIALSTRGWLCEAIRLPGGGWAGLGVGKSDPGGVTPACQGVPWPVDGFSYLDIAIQAPHQRWWRIEYGYAPTAGHPVKVRDMVSGLSAPITDGRYFAIVLPACTGRRCTNHPLLRLETLDASGRVLTKSYLDPGM
jgi:hypothetical protein